MLALRELASRRHGCWALFDIECTLLARLQRVREEIQIEGWLEEWCTKAGLGAPVNEEEAELLACALEREREYRRAKDISECVRIHPSRRNKKLRFGRRERATVEPALWRESMKVVHWWTGLPPPPEDEQEMSDPLGT